MKRQFKEDIRRAWGIKEYFLEQLFSQSINNGEKREWMNALFSVIERE